MRKATVLSMVALLVIAVAGLAHASGPADFMGTDYDLGGQTVTICAWTAGEANRYGPGGEAEGRVEEAEALFNCKIEFAQPGTWQNIAEAYMARLLAGDSAYDIWKITNKVGYFQVAPQGGLLRLNEIYETIPNFQVDFETQKLAICGNQYNLHYWFEKPGETRRLDMGIVGCYFNKDLWEAEGLPDPYELYDNGEWTWETVTELAKQVTRDTDGDGAVDQWFMTRPNELYMILCNGAEIFGENEEGRVVFAYDDPRVESAITQCAEWMREDKVVGTTGYGTGAFVDGKIAIAFMQMWEMNPLKSSLEFDWGLMPYPKGPDSDIEKYYWPNVGLGGYGLPANSAEPEALMALHMFLRWDPEESDEPWNNDWIQKCFTDRKSVEIAWDAAREWNGVCQVLEAPHAIHDSFLTPAITSIVMNGESYSATMEAVKAPIQQMLDDMFNACF